MNLKTAYVNRKRSELSKESRTTIIECLPGHGHWHWHFNDFNDYLMYRLKNGYGHQKGSRTLFTTAYALFRLKTSIT
jgi:hypothetical protein